MAKDAAVIIMLIVIAAAIPDILEGVANRVIDLFGKGDDSEKKP